MKDMTKRQKYLLAVIIALLTIVVAMFGPGERYFMSEGATSEISGAPALPEPFKGFLQSANEYASVYFVNGTLSGSSGTISLGRTYNTSCTWFIPRHHLKNTQDDAQYQMIQYKWNGATSIDWHRVSGSYDADFSLWLIEFAAEADVDVFEYGPYDSAQSVSITEVDTDHAFVSFSGCYSSTTVMSSRDYPVIDLTSSTNAEVRDGCLKYSAFWDGAYFQVISSPNIDVQTGTQARASLIEFVSISSVNTASTLAIAYLQGGAATNPLLGGYATISAYASSSTILYLESGLSYSGTTAYWSVVDFGDLLTVQTSVVNTTASTQSFTEDFSAVDTDHAFTVLSGGTYGYAFGGGKLTDNSDAMGYYWYNGWFEDSDTVKYSLGLATPNAYNLIVHVIEAEGNDPPVNDQAPTCSELDDTDNLYAKEKDYSIVTYVSDVDGYADIDYVDLYGYSNDRGTNYWIVRYDEDTNTFSEVTDASDYITLNTGTSSASRSGTDIDATFEIEINWNHPDISDIDLLVVVADSLAQTDSDYYEVNWDIETRLQIVGVAVDDNFGTPDFGIIDGSYFTTGQIYYYGSGTAVAPPSDEVDIWVSVAQYGSTPGPFEGDTITASGYFNVTTYSDDVEGYDTVTVKAVAEGDGSGGTDLIVSGTTTDIYETDSINIVSLSSGDRKPIGTACTGYIGLYYASDGVNWIGSEGSGYSATGSVGGNTWDFSDYNPIVQPGYDFTEIRSSVQAATYDYADVIVLSDTHGLIAQGATLGDPYSESLTMIWDIANITLLTSDGWTVVGYDATISTTVNVTFQYDGGTTTGTVAFSDGQIRSESVAGIYTYDSEDVTISSLTIDIYDWSSAYVLVEGVQIIFDDAEISSVAYYWVQYSVNQVWLIWISGTWTWEINGTTIDTGADGNVVITSYMNGTSDDWAIITPVTGALDDMVIGAFNPTWYYVALTFNVSTTVDGTSYNWQVWSATLEVDILHSIHINDQDIDVEDVWITFNFLTNWGNATYYIKDNETLVGSSFEGTYQIAKPTTVGLHNYTILLNGSQSTIDASSQTWDYSESDYWVWINWKYTVNPVEVSVDVKSILQNNITCIVAFQIYTPSLVFTWSISEAIAGELDSGTLTISESGAYVSIFWEKSAIDSTDSWNLTITAGSSTVVIPGINIIVDSATYEETYNSSSSNVNITEGDENTYVTDEDTDDVDEAQILLIALIGITITGIVAVVVVRVYYLEQLKLANQ